MFLIKIYIFYISMQYCQCIPWNMVRNDTNYNYELCDSDGNNCFLQKMDDIPMKKECFCLSDCSFVKYSHFETLVPTKESCNDPNAVDQLENPDGLVLLKALTPITNITNWKKTKKEVIREYRKELCLAQKEKDKAIVQVRMEGSTYMKLKRSLRVTFTDKLGSIGGTLGLFSGFSLLAAIELIHWVIKVAYSIIFPKK